MKKYLLLLLVIFLPFAMAFGQNEQRLTTAIQNNSGYAKLIPFAQITVCQYNNQLQCNTPVTIYSDQALTKAISYPFYADANGNFSYFTHPGTYVEQICAPLNQCYTQPVTLIYGGAGSFQSLTTNGTSGAATLNGGVLNIPVYAGSSVNVNGTSVSNPNFNGTTPAAPTGYQNVLWQFTGSNVSGYVPTGTASYPPNPAATTYILTGDSYTNDDFNVLSGPAELISAYDCNSSVPGYCVWTVPSTASLAVGQLVAFTSGSGLVNAGTTPYAAECSTLASSFIGVGYPYGCGVYKIASAGFTSTQFETPYTGTASTCSSSCGSSNYIQSANNWLPAVLQNEPAISGHGLVTWMGCSNGYTLECIATNFSTMFTSYSNGTPTAPVYFVVGEFSNDRALGTNRTAAQMEADLTTVLEDCHAKNWYCFVATQSALKNSFTAAEVNAWIRQQNETAANKITGAYVDWQIDMGPRWSPFATFWAANGSLEPQGAVQYAQYLNTALGYHIPLENTTPGNQLDVGSNNPTWFLESSSGVYQASFVLPDGNTVLGMGYIGGTDHITLPTYAPTVSGGDTCLHIPYQTNSNLDGVVYGTGQPCGSVTSLTTTSTSGAATLTSGVLNIPQYQGALTLTTTGTSGASTLTGNTLNVPQYSTTVSATSPIVSTAVSGGYQISCPTCGTSSGGTNVSINAGSTIANLALTGTIPLLCSDTSGSGTAQSCSTSPTFTLTTGNCFDYQTTTTNSSTALTIAVNGGTALPVAIPGSSGWTTTLTAGIVPANKPLQVCYDGTDLNVQQTGTVSAGGGYPASVTLTASNSAELDFTSCLSSSYNDYQIRFDNMIPATSAADLVIQMSADGGTTYDSTAANYQTAQTYISTNSSSSGFAANLTSFPGFLVSDSNATTANLGVSGAVDIYGVNSTSGETRFTKNIMNASSSSSNMYSEVGGGRYTVVTSARNAFRVIMSSGNIASGTVTCQPLPN